VISGTFPHLSCRILQNPVAGIIGLGLFLFFSALLASAGNVNEAID